MLGLMSLWLEQMMVFLYQQIWAEFKHLTESGLPSDRVQAVRILPSGQVFVGTDKGLALLSKAFKLYLRYNQVKPRVKK